MKNVRRSTCGSLATWSCLPVLGRVLAVLVALALGGQAHARQMPTADDAFTAYRFTEAWVRNLAMPPDAQPGPRAVGACVTLKYNGEVIARGIAWSSSLTGSDAGDANVLRQAAADAIRDAAPKLNIPNDAMRDEALRQIAQDITISVELAGPLSLAEPTTWEDAELTFRPGLDGIGVRIVPSATGVAPGPLIAVFPSQMLLTNQLPHRALSRTVAEAIGEGGAAAAIDDPSKIRDKHAMKMYRFRVQHVVQPKPKADAVALYRGQRLLGATAALGVADLRKFASTLAEYLIACTEIADSPAAGATSPLRTFAKGREGSPLSAHPGSAPGKLVWLALRRYGEFGRHAPSARVAAELEPTLFAHEVPASHPQDSAFAAIIYQPSPRSGIRGIEDIRNAERAVNEIEALIKPVLPSADRSALVGMPLLGWAAMEVASHRRFERLEKSRFPSETASSATRPAPNEADDIPARIAFRQMRSDCWQHQIGITQATDDTLDMIGGIVFTKGLGQGGGGGGNPYPTWQCVRPLAFIATMLGDKRLTEPAERPGEIARLMLALRFLRQLQVDEASAWMYENPSAVVGGIRVSTWDNTVSTDATALTLLCVVETLKSLDAIAAEQAQQAPPAPVSTPSNPAPTGPAPTPK